MDQRPIGIFDSGLGGLTAAKTLEEILPGENLIYFGDSINAPYGTRSREELAKLASANAAFLQSFGVKAVLVACGTVSSNVMDVLERQFDLPFFGVIDAACREAIHRTKTKRIAVIATEATVKSGAFEKALKAMDSSVDVLSKACQSLVTLAERGHFCAGDPAAEKAVAEELASVRAWEPDVLLLACTHFPLLQDVIVEFMGPATNLLSVGAEAARALKEHLCKNAMLSGLETGTRRWFTSGSTADFGGHAETFLGHRICPEQHINEE